MVEVAGDGIFVAGGWNENLRYLNKTEMFDGVTLQWASLADLDIGLSRFWNALAILQGPSNAALQALGMALPFSKPSLE